MKNFLVAVMLVFFLTGCDKSVHSYDEQLVQKIKYVRDTRTGLCFAYAFHGVSIGLTIVPCADVAEHLSSYPLTDKEIENMQSRLPEMEHKAVTASIFK